MTAIIERRLPLPLPNLPDELWEQILSHFSIIDKATTSDAETWANVTNIDDNSLHRVDLDFTRELIAHNIRTKIGLSNVSKLFRDVSRPFLFELIEIRSYDGLLAFGRSVRESSAFANHLSRYTLRLDIIINSSESSATTVERELVIEAIFRACPRLKFVTWFVDGLPEIASVLFHALPKICPNVEALFWKSTVSIRLSTLDLFTNLQIFHSDASDSESIDLDDATLPHMHTLSGTEALFVPFAGVACMPGLKTLIMTGPKQAAVSQPPYLMRFIGTHGTKISSAQLVDQPSALRFYAGWSPNITDLVVQLSPPSGADTFELSLLENISNASIHPDPAIARERPFRFVQFLRILPLHKPDPFLRLQDIRPLHKLFPQVELVARLSLLYKALRNFSVIWESTSWVKGPGPSLPNEVSPAYLFLLHV